MNLTKEQREYINALNKIIELNEELTLLRQEFDACLYKQRAIETKIQIIYESIKEFKKVKPAIIPVKDD